MTPSGTRQANSPVFTLIAVRFPHGGCWHIMLDASSLKRPPPGTRTVWCTAATTAAPSAASAAAPRGQPAVARAPDHRHVRHARPSVAAGVVVSIRVALQLPVLARVDEHVAELRVERRAAPVHAAMVAGKLQAQPVVRRPADRVRRAARLRAASCTPPRAPASRSRCRPASSSCATAARASAETAASWRCARAALRSAARAAPRRRKIDFPVTRSMRNTRPLLLMIADGGNRLAVLLHVEQDRRVRDRRRPRCRDARPGSARGTSRCSRRPRRRSS